MKELNERKNNENLKIDEFKVKLNFEFYKDDFKNGYSTKGYWKDEFRYARTKIHTLEDLKEWALRMKDYLDDFSCYYIKEEVENILNDIIDSATEESVRELDEEFGNVKIEKTIELHDEDMPSKYIISYKGIIIGSELVSYDFMRRNIINWNWNK